MTVLEYGNDIVIIAIRSLLSQLITVSQCHSQPLEPAHHSVAVPFAASSSQLITVSINMDDVTYELVEDDAEFHRVADLFAQKGEDYEVELH